jgi:hypothetical protein
LKSQILELQKSLCFNGSIPQFSIILENDNIAVFVKYIDKIEMENGHPIVQDGRSTKLFSNQCNCQNDC